MKPLLSVLMVLALSGCTGWYPAPVPLNTTYNLDGTSAGNPPRKERVKRPARSSFASIDTTGSVDRSDEDREHELYAELAKVKPNTPEWLAVRKRIESDRTAQYERERSRLMICRNC